MAKMKIYIFALLMQNCIEMYELLMPCHVNNSLRNAAISENNQNINMFGVPPNTLPYRLYIMIVCHWAILHYNMSFKIISGRFDGVF